MDYLKEKENLLKIAKNVEEFEEGTLVMRVEYGKYVTEENYIKHFGTERKANEYIYVANSLDIEKAEKHVEKMTDEELILAICDQFEDEEKNGGIEVYATEAYHDKSN